VCLRDGEEIATKNIFVLKSRRDNVFLLPSIIVKSKGEIEDKIYMLEIKTYVGSGRQKLVSKQQICI